MQFKVKERVKLKRKDLRELHPWARKNLGGVLIVRKVEGRSICAYPPGRKGRTEITSHEDCFVKAD